MKYASNHACERFRKHLCHELDGEAWKSICAHARAGHYPKRKPRRIHPRNTPRRYDHRPRVPIFDVPIRDGERVRIVPMAINTQLQIVVTVLPPPYAEPGQVES